MLRVPFQLLCSLLDDVASSDDSYAMFMIHSSELMPGGSPNFPDEESIDDLFAVIEKTFSHAAELGFKGQGMSGFARDYGMRGRAD